MNPLCRLAFVTAVLYGLFSTAHAQLETRGSRDAAGLREQMSEAGEEAPTLAELSAAYDRASASWMEVFGPAPFEQATLGARRAARALSARGWAPQAHVVVAMLDARGDAAWEEDGSCRAQINIGSNGVSPVAQALGFGAFEFLAAHELAHCLYDQTSPKARAPEFADLLDKKFPLRLTQAQALLIYRLLAKPSAADGSSALAEGYDEALADALASAALLAEDRQFSQVASRAMSLRIGALALAARNKVGPPAHLGAYAIWKSLSGSAPSSLRSARSLAMASSIIHSLATTPSRWTQALKKADPKAYSSLVAQSQTLYASMTLGRDLDADENAYLSARTPSLFIMDLADNGPEGTPERLNLSPEQSMAQWRKAAWIPSGSTLANP
jgi:hypothetical protein